MASSTVSHGPDITLIAADKFLKKLGLIKGKPTLAAQVNGEKLVPEKGLNFR